MAQRFGWRLHLFVVVAAVGVLLPVAVATGQSRFIDVDDSSVFVDDIEWLAEAGVTRGCNPPANDRFCPGSAVTRAQMAAFMRRLAAVFDSDSDGVVDNAETVGGYLPAQLSHAYARYDEKPLQGFDAASWVKLSEVEFDPPMSGLVHVTGVVDYGTTDTEFGHVLAIRVCTKTCGHAARGVDLAKWGDVSPNVAQVVSNAVLPIAEDETTVELWARVLNLPVDIRGRSLTVMFTPLGFAMDCEDETNCYIHTGN